MRPVPKALYAALALAFLAGCGAGIATTPATALAPSSADAPASVVPQWMHPYLIRQEPPVPFVYDDLKKKKKVGIYAAQFYGPDLLGYVAPNQHNLKPICKVAAAFVNGFSVDNLGDLVVPNGYPAEVTVYKGPNACKTVMGKFTDSYGQASDAVAADAATGTIVVGNIEENGSNKAGNIAVCTLATRLHARSAQHAHQLLRRRRGLLEDERRLLDCLGGRPVVQPRHPNLLQGV